MPAGASSTVYTARLLAPDLLVRGRANALSCPLYYDGALVAPTEEGSTVTIYDGSGVAVVDGADVTVTASIATYSYTPASTLTLGEGWRVEWTLVVDGATDTYINDAALVRRGLYPVVTHADLYRRQGALNPSATDRIASFTAGDLQDKLDEAWAIVTNRLISRGNRPNLIMTPSALREVELCLWLALLYEEIAARFLGEGYDLQAQDYRTQYAAAWDDLRFEYDSDDDGASDGRERRAAVPTVWLCGR